MSKYVNLAIDVPSEFSDVEPYRVGCLRHKGKNANQRVMFIVDHVPSEDLKSGRLLSGGTGATLARVINYVQSQYPNLPCSLDDLDILFVNWNCWKTYSMSEERRQDSDVLFRDRAEELISEFKADYVVTCGPVPFKFMAPKAIELSNGEPIGWLGNTLRRKTPDGHSYLLIPNLSLSSLLNPKSIGSSAYLLGYFGRNLLPMFNHGKMPFRIPDIKTGKDRNYEIVFVKTLAQFDKMLASMKKAKYVAIDTETDGLYRIQVKLLTAQFCFDGKTAYVVPFMHDDSPFNTDQIDEMCDKLRDFFEYDNQNRLHIYANAKFDLNIFRNCVGVRSFKNNLWDVIAGEFATDENLKVLSEVTGHWYYRLANITMQYGCRAYLEVPFGKENRSMIKDVPLNDDVLEYASLDVVLPWHIMFQQRKRAAAMKYDKYYSVVSEQISDQIHTFSTLEYTGAATDVDYLFSLALPDSPINSLLFSTVDEFRNMKEVRRANRLLMKRNNIPDSGLFGSVSDSIFRLSKREHVQTLFFDVMKLEPETVSETIRPNGKPEGKVDKRFQDKYKNNPVVAAYTRIAKLNKLRNAYVKSLIRLYGENDDFRTTKRLRPTYNYDRIVTGRCSANDPNLQQVPSRGDLSKYIKRMLISSPGKLIFKVDYSAHEVRGWSIISGDTEVAEVFEVGARLRNRFRLVPDPYIAKRLEYEGDVHKINAAYFFGIPITEVVKKIRDAVKTVIFGLIYQQGDEGLALSTGRKVEEIGEIKGKFLGRFPTGLKWFDKVKDFARKHFFVESPLGRRRNLPGLLVDDSLVGGKSVINRSLRQAVNSPVQGFGSDIMMVAIRLMERRCFEYYQDTGVWPGVKFCISVHDSLSAEVDYDWFWFAVGLIEECMTSAAVEVLQKRHNMKFTSVPEIDFEVGSTEANVSSWDRDYKTVESLVTKALVAKRDELKDKQLLKEGGVESVVNSILQDQYDMMPLWMQKQLWANKIRIKSMNGDSPLTMQERRDAKKWRSEIPTNKPLLAAILEKEEAAKAAQKKAA